MGRNKKHPRIEVRTVPNGYTMTIEGHKQEYLYFSPEKLMEGVMCHIGLKMTEQLSPETIKSFIDSALEWNNMKVQHKEIQRLQRELAQQQKKYRALANRLIVNRTRLLHLVELAKACHLGKHSLTDALNRLHEETKKLAPMKRLTLKELGITCDDIIDDDIEINDDE